MGSAQHSDLVPQHQAATLLAWHRKLAAMKCDTGKRRKPGRPPTVQKPMLA